MSPIRHTAAEALSRNRQGAHAGEQRPSLRSQRLDGAIEEFAGAIDSFGFCTDQADELGDGPVVACRADRDGVGACPPQRHERDHHRRVEHGERRGHDLAGHLTHHRPSAGEVRGTVRQGDVVGRSGAGIEAERGVVGVAFGREVHLADDRLEDANRAGGQKR